MHRIVAATVLCALGLAPGLAQPVLHLKARQSDALLLAPAAELQTEGKRLAAGRRHRVVQFAEPPTTADLDRLTEQGAVILQYVPDQAVLVNAPDSLEIPGRVIFAGALTGADKWSPELDASSAMAELTKEGEEARRSAVVEFYPDVSSGAARQIAGEEGVQLRDHADLSPHHLLVEATPEQLRRLAEWDEVAYVYPASPELIAGQALHACAGAMTQHGMVGQYVARIGEGWEGAGRNAAQLRYLIDGITAKLPAATARAEIERALAEWSKAVKVDFAADGRSTDSRTIHIRFATGAHADPYPFDGPGRVLAHTFYPAPPNPEPLAGDLHLDEAESWRIGNDIDLYSVVLHELGHALGLGHSDKPGAVMYSYYRRATTLTDEDIGAARELYASRDTSATIPVPPVPPAPPSPTPAPAPAPVPPSTTPDKTAPRLAITSPSMVSVLTNAASIQLKGTASDNVGVARIGWTSNVFGTGSATGTVQWTAAVPLAIGYNTITVRAYDAAGNTSWRVVVVTRR